MTKSYYNNLTPYYKYIYPDWDKSLKCQAEVLDGVIREFCGEGGKSVLDAACGIGTQSIGLAKLGYAVAASDLSPGEIEQARLEASRHGVSINFQTVDMCQVWEVYQKQFDVVLACDNAVPHLLSEEKILSAFQGFYQCIKPGGCCLISVRDYASFKKSGKRKQMHPRLVHPTESGQIVLFDVWDFDGEYYEITTYVIEDTGGPAARTQVLRGGKYYCVGIPVLERLFYEAGFTQVYTLSERFFQPLLAAKK